MNLTIKCNYKMGLVARTTDFAVLTFRVSISKQQDTRCLLISLSYICGPGHEFYVLIGYAHYLLLTPMLMQRFSILFEPSSTSNLYFVNSRCNDSDKTAHKCRHV